jgi:molybdate transport system substrate-binding protein
MRTLLAGLLLCGAALLTSSASATPTATPTATPPTRAELTVFAASSLRESFGQLAAQFEALHPGVEVRLNLAGSQELRVQLENGAPGDVFASAEAKHLPALQVQQLARPGAVFARNEPVLVVPRDNPAGLRALADLPRARRIVLGVPEVPIGAYSDRILDAASAALDQANPKAFRARVEAHVVSRELNVRQVLAKVALGEVDAAIVYRTDAATARDRVTSIPIDPAINVVAEYPIAVLTRAQQPRLAEQFVAFVLSAAGQRTLESFGFVPAAQR